MRLHLEIKTENKTIPFNHQHLLVGTIHKWIGENNQHGDISMFSFSRLIKGKATTDGLIFGNNTSFFISAYESDFIKSIIRGIQKDPSMFEGLSVKEIIIQEDPDFTNRELFFIGSPVFIKRRDGNEIKYFFHNDNISSQYLKETLQTKMDKAGLIDDSLEIYFDKTFINPKIQKINYKGVDNKVSWCSLIIKGKPETKLFAWNVGIGNSTGIGFGAIK